MRPDYEPKHGRNNQSDIALNTKEAPFNCSGCQAEVGGCPEGPRCQYGALIHTSTGSHLCRVNTAIESEKDKS